MQNSQSDNATRIDPLNALLAKLQQEVAATTSQRKEIGVLVKQTSAETERLAQRAKDAAARTQQIEKAPDSYSRAEVRQAYEASQEAQMRLFMMRGQLEQLNYRDSYLQRAEDLLGGLLRDASMLPDAPATASAGDRETGPGPRTRGVNGGGLGQGCPRIRGALGKAPLPAASGQYDSDAQRPHPPGPGMRTITGHGPGKDQRGIVATKAVRFRGTEDDTALDSGSAPTGTQ